MDIGYGTFEARAFYLWAWTSDWRNKPTSNISLQIQMYQPGTSWWSNYGNSGGLSGTVSVEKVQYNGNIGEWIWPPIEYDYNTTNLNSSIISGGNGNLTLPVSRSPDGVWKSGSYSVVLRGTDSDSGESDYGQAWFEIRQWDAYASPVTTYGSGYQYKSSFNSKDNISLYVKISEAGDYSGNSGTDLGGNVTISIKKIQDYSSWPPKEINSSSYIATSIVVDESSPWYSSATHASHSGYIINLTPVDGTWDTGYYNVVLDINDTESGWGYFNAIAFYANAEPSDADGDYLYTTNGTGPVFFNVTTTKSQKYYYSSYTNADYIDTTVRDSILRTWSARSYEQIEYNYPEDFNITPLSVNGSTILNFTKNNGNWDSGYYSGEITLEDNESQTANAYLWFNVQLFRVDASSASSTIGTTSNLTVNLSIYNPDWSSNTLLDGNYTVTEVVENNWGYYGNNPTFHTDYSPSASDYFNQETVLRVEAPSGGWTGGWKSATVTVYDNDNEVTQEGWISFEVALFDITVNSVTNQDSITANSNVTVNVSLTNPDDSSDSIGNLSQLYDWDCQYYCIQQYYNFTVGNCKSWIDGSCMINGTQNVNVVVPSGGWSDGYHYLTAVYTETTNADSSKENWDIWFKIAKAYDGWFSNEDEDGNWQYYVGFGDNATFKMYLYNGSQSWPYTYDVDVIVTSVEYSEDGDDCWDDYCRDWTEANWTVVGGNANNTLNGTTGYLTIINPGEWERGYHTVRMNITGDRGSSTIQTGYFYVKDLTGPNITIHSPEENSTITDDFWFNATTSENSTCYLYLLNYGNYDSWYCWNNNTGLCDSTQWTGDTYFYKYISEYVEYDWGYTYGDEDFVTGNHNHRYLFDVSSLSLSDQDYVVYAYCYDVDWNYISKSVPFTYNST